MKRSLSWSINTEKIYVFPMEEFDNFCILSIHCKHDRPAPIDMAMFPISALPHLVDTSRGLIIRSELPHWALHPILLYLLECPWIAIESVGIGAIIVHTNFEIYALYDVILTEAAHHHDLAEEM